MAEAITQYLPDSEEVETAAKEKQNDFKKKLLEQNLLAGDKTEKAAPKETDTSADESGYDNTERKNIDQLFGEQPGFNE